MSKESTPTSLLDDDNDDDRQKTFDNLGALLFPSSLWVNFTNTLWAAVAYSVDHTIKGNILCQFMPLYMPLYAILCQMKCNVAFGLCSKGLVKLTLSLYLCNVDRFSFLQNHSGVTLRTCSAFKAGVLNGFFHTADFLTRTTQLDVSFLFSVLYEGT